jgi:TRAP-type C4-dicarboxylate transport system substrate-binding protein
MTQLLEKAFAEVSQLPEKEQDAIAQRLLAELASEKRWNDLFESSQDELARLADEALAEHRARGTTRL